MINFFNRKVLFQDTNAEAAANVWSTLKANGISYEMSTKTDVSSFRRMAVQNRNVNFNAGGIPSSWTEKHSDNIYVIYVRKNDYEKAKKICNL